MTALPTMGNLPGFSDLQQSVEAAVTWGGDRAPFLEQEGLTIVSTTIDAGNSPTSYLRPGLLLGKQNTGKLANYSAGATDGSQVVFGVLLRGQSMLDLNGIAEEKYGKILVGGPVKAAALQGLTTAARRQMCAGGRFQFDDDIPGQNGFALPPTVEVAKTANYAVLAADNGSLFTNAGAAGEVDFTLPAIAAGLAFEFLCVVAQNLKVISAEGTNIVWDGNASENSLAFSTASHQIGGHLLLYANAGGTKWYVRQLGPSTCTVTAA